MKRTAICICRSEAWRGCGDAAEVTILDVAIRVGELRGVGDVEDLGAKFHLDALGERNVLEEGDIAFSKAGSEERVAAGVALELCRGGHGEGAGDVLRIAGPGNGMGDTGDSGGIEPLGEEPAVGGVIQRERAAAFRLDDRVDLEAADDGVHRVVDVRGEELAVAEGKVIEETADEDVLLVQAGVPLVDGVVVDVELRDGVEPEVAVGVIDVMRPGVRGSEGETLGGTVVELRLERVVVRDAIVGVVDDLAGTGEFREAWLAAASDARKEVEVISGGKVRRFIADVADGSHRAIAHLLLQLQAVLLDVGGFLRGVDRKDV